MLKNEIPLIFELLQKHGEQQFKQTMKEVFSGRTYRAVNLSHILDKLGNNKAS